MKKLKESELEESLRKYRESIERAFSTIYILCWIWIIWCSLVAIVFFFIAIKMFLYRTL